MGDNHSAGLWPRIPVPAIEEEQSLESLLAAFLFTKTQLFAFIIFIFFKIFFVFIFIYLFFFFSLREQEPSPGASRGKEGTFCPRGEPEGVQNTHRVLSHPKSGGKHLCPVAQPNQGMQSCPTKVTLLGTAKASLELSSKGTNSSLLQEITWQSSCDAADGLNARNSSNSRISPRNGSASKPQRCFGCTALPKSRHCFSLL